jgi:DNA-binding transcriptional MocR family regulator
MTTLPLAVDRSSGIPLHRQIYEGIRGAILDGLLRPGERVSSTRHLALELAVSRLPVLTAYDQMPLPARAGLAGSPDRCCGRPTTGAWARSG